MRHAHAMRFGATLDASGRGARFRLWAPGARHAELLLHGDGLRSAAATRDAGGWCEAVVADAAAGQRYQWRIDGELAVPDPASRFNPDGPHGPSELLDPHAFTWDDAGWRGRPWHEAVIYELHVGTFTDEGRYASAAARLSELASLGITAIQLMPLADFPGRFGWGYDGVLPFAPFHGYGRPDELKAFVQAAHRLGLMVFADVVYNHFGPDGNYLHAYAPGFFSERHVTGWGAAINVDDDARGAATVREFFIDNALYWLDEFRFDGLRFDAVHAIPDERRPGFLHELSERVRAATAGRHVHLVLENDHNDPARLGPPGTPGRYDGQWSGDVHHGLHVLLTGERDGYYAEYDAPLEQLGRALAHGFSRQGAPHVAGSRRAAEGQAPLGAVVNMLQTHDQIGNRAFGERLLALAGADAVKLAAAIVLLAPTTPMLFMGEELGATTPFLYFCDWQGALRDAVREGRRKEFEHFPRFAEAAREGRLPDPCSEATFEACKRWREAAASDAARAWRDFHAALLALRARLLTPSLESLPFDGHEARCHGTLLQLHWRLGGGRRWLMQVNLSAETVAHDAAAGFEPIDADPACALGRIDADGFGPWSGRWLA
ncbi:MAG TPA: malto-oligosyltrehalose trehalohydrolase [Methylibium sp.]|uniref:malto-oligosyltrehalose trehalohydrolase n=1 Tax=Methylibium sp. TaxID=2067992 RepID=UPI002DB97A05|nr:malto-oligosyltrehalose trehalohydrolase [Methylibium sp.]HEU4460836.1 malto-oligosyltrehalose trehalohydrolase [Methylibium sp.]